MYTCKIEYCYGSIFTKTETERFYKAAMAMLISSMTGIFNHSVVTVTADITCRVMQSLLQKYLNNLAQFHYLVTINYSSKILCI